MQRAQDLARRQRLVGELGLRQRAIAAEGDHRIDAGIHLIDACIAGLDCVDRGDLLLADHLRHLRGRDVQGIGGGVLGRQIGCRRRGRRRVGKTDTLRRGHGNGGGDTRLDEELAAGVGMIVVHKVYVPESKRETWNLEIDCVAFRAGASSSRRSCSRGSLQRRDRCPRATERQRPECRWAACRRPNCRSGPRPRASRCC